MLHIVLNPVADGLPVRPYAGGAVFVNVVAGTTVDVIYNVAPYQDGHTIDVWVGDGHISRTRETIKPWRTEYRQVMHIESWGGMFEHFPTADITSGEMLQLLKPAARIFIHQLNKATRIPKFTLVSPLTSAKILEREFLQNVGIKVRITPKKMNETYALFKDAFPGGEFPMDKQLSLFYAYDLIRFGLRYNEIKFYHPRSKKWLNYSDFYRDPNNYGILMSDLSRKK